jgi:predicted membrane protein
MSINIDPQNKDPRSSRVLAGAFLLAIGVIVLFHQLNFFFFPWWLFRWYTILIVIGLYSGIKHNFRNATWIILILIGGLNLLDNALPFIHFSNAIWPLILIVFGIKMIMNRNHPWKKDCWDKDRWKRQWNGNSFGGTPNPDEPSVDYTVPNNDDTTGTTDSKSNLGDDYLDTVSIFSGAKKRVLSKNFKGGEIVNIFGGADIDLTQADIQGRVIIDVTQVFGGIKLIVPPHWHVTSDMVALFAGFDDKRMMKSDYGSDKILVLKGTSIFAGVDIRSY